MKASIPNLGKYEVELIEKGQAIARVEKLEETESRTQRTGLNIQLVILEGPQTTLGGESEGRMIFDTLWYPKADDPPHVKNMMGKQVQDFYDAIGADYESDFEDMTGSEVQITIGHNAGDPEMGYEPREEVKRYKKVR